MLLIAVVLKLVFLDGIQLPEASIFLGTRGLFGFKASFGFRLQCFLLAAVLDQLGHLFVLGGLVVFLAVLDIDFPAGQACS